MLLDQLEVKSLLAGPLPEALGDAASGLRADLERAQIGLVPKGDTVNHRGWAFAGHRLAGLGHDCRE